MIIVFNKHSMLLGQKDVVCQKDAREAKREDIQKNGKTAIVVWGRGLVDNEKLSTATGGECDEDAAMDVRSHGDQ